MKQHNSMAPGAAAPPKRGFMQRVGRALELPDTVVTSGPYIEIHGTGEMVVEGCKGILDYDGNLVRLSVGRFAVTVLGEKLEITHYSDGSCTVAGEIRNIGFGV